MEQSDCVSKVPLGQATLMPVQSTEILLVNIMPLIRILIIIAIIWLLIHLFKQYRERRMEHLSNAQEQKKITDQMVKCAHCGLHMPETEAIKQGHSYYCSQEHYQTESGEK